MNEHRMVTRKLEAHAQSHGWRAPVVAACLTGIIVNAAAGVPPHASVGAGATGMLSHAIDLVPMSSTSPIDLTVWLKIRDSVGLDRALAAQSTSGVGWLSEAQIDQLHAPAASDVGAVSTFLRARGAHSHECGSSRSLFNSSTDWRVLTFGTDSQLHAGPGWDPATGLGTPNGVAFVNALSAR